MHPVYYMGAVSLKAVAAAEPKSRYWQILARNLSVAAWHGNSLNGIMAGLLMPTGDYTSYVSGWKTDQGMLYSIWPTYQRLQSANDEIWVYGNESNPAALLEFDFLIRKKTCSATTIISSMRSPFLRKLGCTVSNIGARQCYLDSRR